MNIGIDMIRKEHALYWLVKFDMRIVNKQTKSSNTMCNQIIDPFIGSTRKILISQSNYKEKDRNYFFTMSGQLTINKTSCSW